MKIELAITGVGLISPIGHSALACMHAVRSNQSGLMLLPLPDRVKNWIVGGKIPQWTPYGGRRHWETVGGFALRQAWEQANRCGALSPDAPVALVLGRADAVRPDPVFPHTDLDVSGWMHQLVGRTPEKVNFVQAGACNAQAGLRIAAQRFAAGKAQACIIGAIDSQVQLRVVRWHEDNLRLKCSYITDGLMPSEAAAFLVVEPFERAARRGAYILARVDSVVGALEEATVLSDKPNVATASTHVTVTALREAGVAVESIGMVWSDLNGESYKAREWAFTAVRVGVRDGTRLMHPADCHGDLGGATDTHLLGLAAMAQASGWSTQPILVVSGADTGLRAATVLSHGSGTTGVVPVSGGCPRLMSTTFRLPPCPDKPADFRQTADPHKSCFHWQVRHAHQDDIAALFYQRRAMLNDPDTPWPRLAEPERRLMEHLDAVVAGGPEAMAFQASGVTSDEDGIAFGAALLIGQIPSTANLLLMESALREAEGPRLAGLIEGLQHSPLSQSLQHAATGWLASENAGLRAGALRFLSRHRIAVAGPAAAQSFLRSDATAIELAEASWRLGWSHLAPMLKDLLSHDSPGLRQAALIAMICFVPKSAAMFCRSRLRENAAFGGSLATGLALCGNLDDTSLLLARAAQEPADHAAIEALGILGSALALPVLVEWLADKDPRRAACAEQALRLVTGKQLPLTSTLQQAWRQWLAEMGASFDVSTRWRRGDAFNPATCVDELADASVPLPQRRRAQCELVRWVGPHTAYEPDAFAVVQLAAIKELRQ
jgi:3-oxoacyl-[acyl-carrier-protein] synthase-1